MVSSTLTSVPVDVCGLEGIEPATPSSFGLDDDVVRRFDLNIHVAAFDPVSRTPQSSERLRDEFLEFAGIVPVSTGRLEAAGKIGRLFVARVVDVVYFSPASVSSARTVSTDSYSSLSRVSRLLETLVNPWGR